MSPTQQKIIKGLLLGGDISGSPNHGYRLRDAKGNPVTKFKARTWYHVRKLCRRQKGAFVIDKRIVRSLHGRHFAKKEYNRIAALRKASTQAPAHQLAQN